MPSYIFRNYKKTLVNREGVSCDEYMRNSQTLADPGILLNK